MLQYTSHRTQSTQEPLLRKGSNMNNLFDCCHDNKNDDASTNYNAPQRRKKARTMDPQETDLLIRDMNELSVEEREKVMDDIHGVYKTPEETPEFIAAAIEAFDAALESRVYKKDRWALDRAFFLRPSLKTDNQFKLWFLRTEYFDAKKAANRMARYYRSKLVLFGKENLAKDITLENLTEKEVEKTFGVGFMKVLPNKDSSGRLVIISYPGLWDFNDNLTMLKGCWCCFMNILRSDEVASKRGFADVAYTPGNLFGNASPAAVIKGAKEITELIVDSFPFRYASFHYCYNDPGVHLFLSTIHMAMNTHLRMRIRMHYGTPIEIQYALMTFGIHCESGRGREHNETKTNNNKQDSTDEEGGDNTHSCRKDTQLLLLHEDNRCLERIMEMELRHSQMKKEEEARTGIILYPNPNDVLIGRGKSYHDYCGNQRYQNLIEAELDKYYDEANGAFEKTCITMNMVKTIQDLGGRFLAPVAGRGWKVLDDTVARSKTAVSFRSRYSMHKTQASKLS